MNITEEKKLELVHRSEIDKLVKIFNPVFSEYAFSNLYLFRREHDYTIIRDRDFVFLQGITYDSMPYLMPLTPLGELGVPYLKGLMAMGISLFPISEKDLHIFDHDDDIEFSYNIDDSDYVYTREKIATYPGRNLSKKRNLMKQYRTLYQYEDKEYSCTHAADALAVLDKWFEIGGLPLADTDYVACAEAINHCADFGLTGRIFYAEGEPSGFLLGEGLNENTFVIHFAKGVTSYKGIYVHMYNSLANALPTQYTYLNFEQDLGKESLRQAKSTYITDFMLHKYRVSLKK
ncbi:MAG: phosphatidylglycerol lysyltransferase domain-containing protein [Deferribacteraceae bacterium]|jgi:hypothetical protein|nr:phosphatidylglycerol lysyltransferase domain-containing protein [Deferribacteraceae bacterium]